MTIKYYKSSLEGSQEGLADFYRLQEGTYYFYNGEYWEMSNYNHHPIYLSDNLIEIPPDRFILEELRK